MGEKIEAGAAPRIVMPPDAWDCHMHVFGPYDRFPARQSAYALPLADRDRHADLLAGLGLAHALLIQPSPYGDDHAAILDAIARSGGRFRGIGSCDAAITQSALRDLRDGGVVGLRFVGVPGPGGTAYPGTQGLDTWNALRDRMDELGLHAHLWADTATSISAARVATHRGTPLVLDHLAGLGPDDRPGTPRFDALAELLAGGAVWIKLTWFRRSRGAMDYDDMESTVRALAEAAPDRVLWGSDWPFVRADPPPAPARLIGQLHAWLGADAFRRCLSDNPAALLGVGARDAPEAAAP